MLTGGKLVIKFCFYVRYCFVELPWDQPSYQNPEYKRWLDRDYYHNPWKKIDNMILSMKKKKFFYRIFVKNLFFSDLLRRILTHDPAQRAKVIDIQSHKWMSKVYPQGIIL
jgi:serine/threonine protein kinase